MDVIATLAGTASDALGGLALVVGLGVGAQWLAWRVRIPSILMLLACGLAVGPLSTLLNSDGRPILDPDALIGQDLLIALVSLSVALILYEGGLTLRFSEISRVRGVVGNLVTIGAVVTWALSAAAAQQLLGLSVSLAVLLGGLMIVTGPTVVGPMLQHIRPIGSVGPILKWEGIVIDPIGALAAVLVFEVILVGHNASATNEAIKAVLLTIVVGGGLGALAALVLMMVIKRFWVPDFLQNPISILLVVLVFALCDRIQHESGLLAVTVMGIVLANQTTANVGHIIEFKENLRVLIISSLFIVLGARLQIEDIRSIGFEAVGFVLILIIAVRPLAVWVSTVGSGLSTKEKIFLSCLAPRGIVAAAIASVFALALEARGIDGAEKLVPYTFAVIVGTVAVYGLIGPIAAKRLALADQNPQGLIFLGAQSWSRMIASVLKDQGFKVLVVDSNYDNIRQARMAGIPTYTGNILAEHTVSEIDLTGMGRFVALTPNNEVNALAAQRFFRLFGKRYVYQLAQKTDGKREGAMSHESHGRSLFGADTTFATLDSRFNKGHIVKATTLTDEFTYQDYRTLYGPRALILFTIENKRIRVATADAPIEPASGQRLISLIDPDDLLFAD